MDEKKLTLAAAGMATDTRYKNQPQGKARYILNGVLESAVGDNPALINELGNTLCTVIPRGYTIIGALQLDGPEFVIFSAGPASTNDPLQANGSEIGLFNQLTCNYIPFLNEPCLNFTTKDRIKAEFRILKGCERIIYFTDSVNSYKSINLDDMDNYYKDGIFQCNSIELSPSFTIPCISDINVLDFGGTTKLGAYYFRIRYLDDNFNPTNWQLLTKPTPIVDEFLYANYFTVDGGINIVNSSTELGSVPPSNKSIELTITDLDTSFKYYQLAVIIKSEGNNQANEAYLLKEVSIGSTSDIYIYTGSNPNSDIKTDVSALIVDQEVIDIVEDHVQHDSRLFLGGLSYKKYDYAAVQRQAEKVKVKWVVKHEKWEDINQGSSKSPKSYTNSRSFMRDEVYALGIIGTNKKGWKTPAFHIAGRTTITDPSLINLGNNNIFWEHYRKDVPVGNINWDKTLLIISQEGNPNNNNSTRIPLAEVRHLGYNESVFDDATPTQVERWKIWNTAIVETNGLTPSYLDPTTGLTILGIVYPRLGVMAYHESDKDYPNTVDCDGKRIYPEGKIRHHRFPDTTLVPIYVRHVEDNFPNNNTEDITTEPGSKFPIYRGAVFILPMGLEFDLQEFIDSLPADIQQDFTWEVVVADREFNKTVLDKGYLMSTTRITTGGELVDDSLVPSHIGIVPAMFNASIPQSKLATFITPRETFYKDNLQGSFIKNERTVYQGYISASFDLDHNCLVTDFSRSSQKTQQIDWTNVYQFGSRTIQLNKFISAPVYPIERVFDTLDIGLIDNPFVNFADTIANYNHTKDMKLIATIDPFVSSLRFNIVQGTNKPVWINPDPNHYYHLVYASMKSTFDPYSNLDNIKYRPLESCTKLKPVILNPLAKSYLSYSGDIHIGYLAHRISSAIPSSDVSKAFFNFVNREGTFSNVSAGLDNYFAAFYESDINVELRHGSIEPGNGYLRSKLDPSVFNNIFFDNFWYSALPGDDDPELLNKEFWGYNKDYSAIPNIVNYFPVSNKYDYCTKCENRFPFRLKYSEKSFQDSIIDKYKTFLPNNFIDIDGSTGSISALIKHREELYTFTHRALFMIPTRPQTLTTDANVIYLGTGDVFSIPPRRINSLNYAYMGTTDKFSIKTTEFGTVWIDDLTGKVFMLGEGVDDISAKGMRSFFENNIKLNLKEQTLIDYGQNYTFLSPTHVLGIGYTTTYDPRYRRLIISKQDYKLRKTDGVTYSPQLGYRLNGGLLALNNAEYFENLSTTISYSFTDQTWASFHSYIPDFMFNGENTFFTTIRNEIWEHNKGNHQTYYKGKYDFIVDVIAAPNPHLTSTFGPIQIQSQVFSLDQTNNTKQYDQIYDTTFDKLLCYSSDSSTGLQQLRLQTDWSSVLDDSNNIAYFEPKGKSYNVNDILNYISPTSKNPLTASWDAIGNFFPIDAVSNQAFIDVNKDPFTVSRIVDDYMAIRLYFKPNLNYKIVFDGLIYQYKPFIR